MTDEQFEQLVQAGFDQLPDGLRQKISNVALFFADEPSEEVRTREGLRDDETLLGYYQGIPLSERGTIYGVGFVMPDTITLFKLPILEAAQESGTPIERIISETIWHEYAHHFGLSESEVEAWEKKGSAHRAPHDD